MIFDFLKDKFQLRFKNRETAASILAGALEDSFKKIKIGKKQDHVVVLGIPRGGVVVADIVYSKLKSSSSSHIEFDIIVPRRLGAPGNQEIGIGAIIITKEDDEKTISYLNEDLIRELDIPQEHIEKEKAIQIEEIKRRKSLFRNSSSNVKEEYDLKDKIVIIVDDGAATGATLIATARWVREKNPKKLIIAIPVATKDTVELLKKECDIVITGTTASSTSSFKSVGQFYQEFKPVDDEKVIEICKKDRKEYS
jgi:putative phosphoribosyl transferase